MKIGLLLLLGVVLAGCASSKNEKRDYTATSARFFLEAGGDSTGMAIQLPQSGVTVAINQKPVITEGDIVGVELVQVELGKALMFKLNGSASRDFYRLTGTHQGRRLVLTLNDASVGARRIDGAIPDGVIFIFVEVPDDDLPKLVENLKKTTIDVQKEIKRKG
ncbi:MAG TPA: hypothetical protein VGE76_14550 [Opitutaceae bacterium]